MPHMEFTGASVVTTLRTGISAVAGTIPLQSGSGWPTGAGGKVFTATLGDPLSGQPEEKILCSVRSDNDLTAVQRGYDGTAAQEWGPNTRIRHTISGVFCAEMSDHVWDDNRDDHGQYHTATRHAAVSHSLAMMGTNSVGTLQIVDDAVTAAKILAGAVTTPKILDANVTTAKIADLNVTSPKLADGIIANGAKVATGQALAHVAATAPGSPVANMLWFNTTKRALLVRDAGNANWEVVETFGAGIDYTPTLYNITLGSGGINKARYRRHGRSIIADGFVQLGTGGDVTGLLGVGLPLNAVNIADIVHHGATRASQDATGQVFAAVGLIGTGAAGVDRISFFATAGSAGWDGTTPFNWTINDRFSWFAEYEAASAIDANFV